MSNIDYNLSKYPSLSGEPMRTVLWSFLYILSGALSSNVWAEEENTKANSPPVDTQMIQLNHGTILTYDQIAAIANIQSARDQSGNPVTLDKTVKYTLGSFTRATMSVVPPGGGMGNEITLDLSRKETPTDASDPSH
jgi:hypothetical protein